MVLPDMVVPYIFLVKVTSQSVIARSWKIRLIFTEEQFSPTVSEASELSMAPEFLTIRGFFRATIFISPILKILSNWMVFQFLMPTLKILCMHNKSHLCLKMWSIIICSLALIRKKALLFSASDAERLTYKTLGSKESEVRLEVHCI